MTNLTIDPHNSYVYALFREDGETPFYIGKGHGRRMLIHERDAHKGTSHKDRVIQNMHKSGRRVRCEKLIEGLSDTEARQIEIDLIALLLRWPHGPLANLTDGGDGARNTPLESRAKQTEANRRSWKDPDVRAKRLAGMRRTLSTPEMKKILSERVRASRTPEVIAKIKATQIARGLTGRKPKPPKKDRIAELKKLWADPERREIMMQRRREWRAAHPLSDEQKAAGAARLNSPEAVAKRTSTGTIPEIREKRIAAQKRSFSTPEAKAKRSEVSKNMWVAKKAQKVAPDESAMLSQLTP